MDRVLAMSAFVRVVQTRSFTRVAEEFNTKQPTISKWIAGLEQHLGARLLNRNTRKIEITQVGEKYFKSCQFILNELDHAEAEVKQTEASPSGHIKLSTPLVFGKKYIVPEVSAFMESHQGFTFEIEFTDRQVDIIEENIDLALRVGELESSSLIAKRLTSFKRLLVASPTYLKTHGTPKNPGDLINYDCITHSRDDWHFYRGQSKKSVAVQSCVQTNSVEALTEMALESVGIALLPEWMVTEHLAGGRLVQLLKGYKTENRNISMVYPQKHYIPLGVQMFMNQLTERFS